MERHRPRAGLLSPAPAGAWQPIDGGLRLDVRVQPGARKAGFAGLETRDDGRTRLKLKVSAPPDDGKANAAVVALLAKALGVARRDVALLSGETARDKTLRIAGGPRVLTGRLRALATEGR